MKTHKGGRIPPKVRRWLLESERQSIAQEALLGNFSVQEIAKRFQVTQRTVYKIRAEARKRLNSSAGLK